MLPLSSTKWVFFRRERGEEVYVSGMDTDRSVDVSFDVRDAFGFDTAAQAYFYGKRLAPALDDWRVGLRGAIRG